MLFRGTGRSTRPASRRPCADSLQFTVLKGQTLDWPRAETPTHHILMGFDPDLEGATKIASGEAYAVASMAVDLRVTELVDGNVGVHAMVAKSLLR